MINPIWCAPSVLRGGAGDASAGECPRINDFTETNVRPMMIFAVSNFATSWEKLAQLNFSSFIFARLGWASAWAQSWAGWV